MGTAEKEKKNVAKGFQPLGERVFVTYTEELDRTAGGIYVPDSAKETPPSCHTNRVSQSRFK